MEEETAATTTFWCHTCSRRVTPQADVRCPFCQSGFLEEMQQRDTNVWRPGTPLWASLLMETMNNSPRNNQTVETENENDRVAGGGGGGGDYMESQLQEMLRRRGRRPVSVTQLLQGIRAGLTLAPAPAADSDTNNPHDDRERGRVIVTNPYNQIVAVPSSAVSDTLPPVVAGSLSEYFIGPEFEAMLERLTETDLRRYGTPPAGRDAVEALANVIMLEPGLQCSVCLDGFEVGTVGKQMPCKHKFHPHCLLPWLELHSSCPVCRYQLPTAEDETMTDSATTETNGGNGGGGFSSTNSSQGSESNDGNRDEEDADGDRSMLDPMEEA